MALVVKYPRPDETRWHSYGAPRAVLPEQDPAPLHVIQDVLVPLGISREQLNKESLYFTVCMVLKNKDRFPLQSAQRAALCALQGRIDLLAGTAHAIHYELVLPASIRDTASRYRRLEDLMEEAYANYVAAGITQTYADELTLYQKMTRMWSVTDFAENINNIVRGAPDKEVATLNRKNFWYQRRPTLEQRMAQHYGPDALGTPASQWAMGHMVGLSKDPYNGQHRPASIDSFADVRGPYSDPLHNYGIHAVLDTPHAWGVSTNVSPAARVQDYHYVCCGQPLGSPGCLVGGQTVVQGIPQPTPHPWFGGWFDDDTRLGQLVTMVKGSRPIYSVRIALERSANLRGTTFVPYQERQDRVHASMMDLVVNQGLASALANAFVSMRNGKHGTLVDALAAADARAAQDPGTYLKRLREYNQYYVQYNGPIFHSQQDGVDAATDGDLERLFHVDRWTVVSSVPVPRTRPKGGEPTIPIVIPRVTPKDQPLPYLELDPFDVATFLKTDRRISWLDRLRRVLSSTPETPEYQTDRDILNLIQTDISYKVIQRLKKLEQLAQSATLNRGQELIYAMQLKPNDPDNQLSLLVQRVATLERALESERNDVITLLTNLNEQVIKPFNAIHRVTPSKRSNVQVSGLNGVMTKALQLKERQSILPSDVQRALQGKDEDLEELIKYGNDVYERRRTDIPAEVQEMKRIISQCEMELVTGTALKQSVTASYVEMKWNMPECHEQLSELLQRSQLDVLNTDQMARFLQVGKNVGILQMVSKTTTGWLGFTSTTTYEPAFRKWDLVDALPETPQADVYYLPRVADNTENVTESVSMALVAFLTSYFETWKDLLTQEYRQRNNRATPEFRERVVRQLESTQDLAQKLIDARRIAFQGQDDNDYEDDVGHGLYVLTANERDNVEKVRQKLLHILDLMQKNEAKKKTTRKAINKVAELLLNTMDATAWSDAQSHVLQDFTYAVHLLIPKTASRVQRAFYVQFLLQILDLLEQLGVHLPKVMDNNNITNVRADQLQLRLPTLLDDLDQNSATWVSVVKELTKEPASPKGKEEEEPASPRGDAGSDKGREKEEEEEEESPRRRQILERIKEIDEEANRIWAEQQKYRSTSQVWQKLDKQRLDLYKERSMLIRELDTLPRGGTKKEPASHRGDAGSDKGRKEEEKEPGSPRGEAGSDEFQDARTHEQAPDGFVYANEPLRMNQQELGVAMHLYHLFEREGIVNETLDFDGAVLSRTKMAGTSAAIALLRNIVVSGLFTSDYTVVPNRTLGTGLNKVQYNLLMPFMKNAGFHRDNFLGERITSGGRVDPSQDRLMSQWGFADASEFPTGSIDQLSSMDIEQVRNAPKFSQYPQIVLPSLQEPSESGIPGKMDVVVPVEYYRWACFQMYLLTGALLAVCEFTPVGLTVGDTLELLQEHSNKRQQLLMKYRQLIQRNPSPVETEFSSFGTKQVDDEEDDTEEMESEDVSGPWFSNSGLQGAYRLYREQLRAESKRDTFVGLTFIERINQQVMGEGMRRIKDIVEKQAAPVQITAIRRVGASIGAYQNHAWNINGFMGIRQGDVPSRKKNVLYIRGATDQRKYTFDKTSMEALLQAYARFFDFVAYIVGTNAEQAYRNKTLNQVVERHLEWVATLELEFTTTYPETIYEGYTGVTNQNADYQWQAIGPALPSGTTETLQRANETLANDDLDWDGDLDKQYIYPILHLFSTMVKKPELQGRLSTYLSIETLANIGAIRYDGQRYFIVDGLTTQGAFGLNHMGTLFFVGSVHPLTKESSVYPRDVQLRLLQRWGDFGALLEVLNDEPLDMQRAHLLQQQMAQPWI